MRFSAVVAQSAFLMHYQYSIIAFSSGASRPSSSSSNGQHNEIFSDIHTINNAFVNNNAADRGLGRLYMSKNDNVDEDNVEDLHGINEKKGLSPVGILGASTVITTQLHATKVCICCNDLTGFVSFKICAHLVHKNC